jgi:hypothetical protein
MHLSIADPGTGHAQPGPVRVALGRSFERRDAGSLRGAEPCRELTDGRPARR